MKLDAKFKTSKQSAVQSINLISNHGQKLRTSWLNKRVSLNNKLTNSENLPNTEVHQSSCWKKSNQTEFSPKTNKNSTQSLMRCKNFLLILKLLIELLKFHLTYLLPEDSITTLDLFSKLS